MASPLIIRPATASDLTAIRRLQRQWMRERSTWGYRADSTGAIRRLLEGIAQVAEADGRAVGFAFGRLRVHGANAVIRRRHRVCEIIDLYVSPRHRRRGAASKLIAAVIADGRRAGAKAQYVYSAAKDLGAVLALYGKQGFASWYVTLYRSDR
jgi:GNAT superfamily N-acetyltransferase